MGISRNYLKEHRFVLTTLSCELNDRNLREHVLALNRETDGMPDLRELGDCRALKYLDSLTAKGAAECANCEVDRPESLLAIVVPESPLVFGMSRAYQTFSQERRKEVKIFKDMNEAITWLAHDDNEAGIFRRFVESCQVSDTVLEQ